MTTVQVRSLLDTDDPETFKLLPVQTAIDLPKKRRRRGNKRSLSSSRFVHAFSIIWKMIVFTSSNILCNILDNVTLFNIYVFFFCFFLFIVDSQVHPDTLLHWLQRQVALYDGVRIHDMGESFKSGLAIAAIINRYRPDLIDFHALKKDDNIANNQLAFDILEKELGIPPVSFLMS